MATPKKRAPQQPAEVLDADAVQRRIETAMHALLPAHLKDRNGVPLRDEDKEKISNLAGEYIYRKLDKIVETNTEQPLKSAVDKSLSEIEGKTSEILALLAQPSVADAINSYRSELSSIRLEAPSLNDVRVYLELLSSAASFSTSKTAKNRK